MSEMREDEALIQEFLTESYENLDRLDEDLIDLEQDPTNTGTLSSVFRTLHTLKGTVGFLSFHKLESLAHAGETLLAKLRDGELQLNEDMTSALLATLDALREMLQHVEQTMTEGDGDYSDLVATLKRLTAGESVAPCSAEANGADDRPAEQAETTAPEPAAPSSAQAGADPEQEAAADEPDVETADAQHDDEAASPATETLEEPAVTPTSDVAQAADSDVEAEGEMAETQPTTPQTDSRQGAPAGQAADGNKAAVAESSIRVNVHLLDQLMNLVGELVLARNQILQYSAKYSDASLVSTTQRLNLLTTELQEGVMKTRMQPIGSIWRKLPRVVRDLSVACNKKIRLEMEGQETELDRTIIEAIKDPLTHLVRNSVDHGVETPEERTAAGKDGEGLLRLRAFHEGGQVNIEIQDDGRGINLNRVKEKATNAGVITPEHANRMTDREITELIFMPGLSTAKKVTNVSGRGVGMDVVKTNIEKIGGTVDLQTTPGSGTTIKIKIPLTLAIIPGLIVTSNGDRYAIPQVSLVELVRLEGEAARKGIEHVHGVPVYRLRDQLLPIVELSRALGADGEVGKSRDDGEDEVINIVVLQADGRQFGLIVEAIQDTEEIVVKPLGRQIKNVPVFAGATIMGDGRVALILDVLGLAQHTGVVSELRKRRAALDKELSVDTEDRQTLLVFGLGERRMALPLSMVARLEEFERSRVENAGDQPVIQYRGEILPLVDLSSTLGGGRSREDADVLQVVVYSEADRTVGLVVGAIHDIVEEQVKAQMESDHPQILGTAIIQGKVTDIVDIQRVV